MTISQAPTGSQTSQGSQVIVQGVPVQVPVVSGGITLINTSDTDITLCTSEQFESGTTVDFAPGVCLPWGGNTLWAKTNDGSVVYVLVLQGLINYYNPNVVTGVVVTTDVGVENAAERTLFTSNIGGLRAAGFSYSPGGPIAILGNPPAGKWWRLHKIIVLPESGVVGGGDQIFGLEYYDTAVEYYFSLLATNSTYAPVTDNLNGILAAAQVTWSSFGGSSAGTSGQAWLMYDYVDTVTNLNSGGP